MTHLVILRSELVQTLLNDMVTVQVFDKSNHMETEGEDDGMNLICGVSMAKERYLVDQPVA